MSEGLAQDSVSFGNEITSQIPSHNTLRRPSDKQYLNLELNREVCQMKLNELLSQQITSKYAGKKHHSISSGVSIDDYYALLKRCLDAEAKVQRQNRELDQIRRKHSAKVLSLEEEIKWLKGANAKFMSEGRSRETPNLRIETNFDQEHG